jgi:23S rRNA pseudouridine2604 synthase
MALKRVRIMNINLDVAKGKWRDLTDKELADINKLIEKSRKTHD